MSNLRKPDAYNSIPKTLEFVMERGMPREEAIAKISEGLRAGHITDDDLDTGHPARQGTGTAPYYWKHLLRDHRVDFVDWETGAVRITLAAADPTNNTELLFKGTPLHWSQGIGYPTLNWEEVRRELKLPKFQAPKQTKINVKKKIIEEAPAYFEILRSKGEDITFPKFSNHFSKKYDGLIGDTILRDDVWPEVKPADAIKPGRPPKRNDFSGK
jgi:hypothetical protein